jgi:hypothetical protein
MSTIPEIHSGVIDAPVSFEYATLLTTDAIAFATAFRSRVRIGSLRPPPGSSRVRSGKLAGGVPTEVASLFTVGAVSAYLWCAKIRFGR